MKKLQFKYIFLLFFILTSCQTFPVSQSTCQQGEQTVSKADIPVHSLEPLLNEGLRKQKIENLIVLVDDSSRLLKCRDKKLIRSDVFDLVDRINTSLAGISINKGIRIFGPHADRNDFKTATVYGMAGSEISELKPSVITMTPKNSMLNPLSMALESIYHELKGVKGKTAVLLLSDFERLNSEVYSTIDMITNYYDDNICLYGIYVGDDKDYDNFLNKILGVNACGFFTKEQSLTDPALLVDYLDKVLFDIVPVVETTKMHDAVSSEHKTAMKMPEKDEPEVIEPERDKKAAKEKPVLSYKKLTIEKELRIELKTEFDLGRSVIRPEYAGHLEAIAAFMKKHSNTTILIEGHTCNLGSDKYNVNLSQMRAEAVKNYLVDTLSVDAKRIATKPFGETKPKADNSTEEGRQQNRRAEAVITTFVTEEIVVPQNTLTSSTVPSFTGSDRFEVIDADSVLDKKTDLMWGTRDNGHDIDFLEAEKFCEKYNGGGFSDWRMATQEELETLYTPNQKNDDGFFITELIKLTDCCPWASDVSMNSAGIFSFKTGNQPWGYQSDTYKLRALPVRDAK